MRTRVTLRVLSKTRNGTEQRGIFRPVPPTKVRNDVAPTWMMESFFCKRTTQFFLGEVVEILENPPEKWLQYLHRDLVQEKLTFTKQPVQEKRVSDLAN